MESSNNITNEMMNQMNVYLYYYTKYLEYFESLSSYLQKQCSKIFKLRDKIKDKNWGEEEVNAYILKNNRLAKKLHVMLDDMNPNQIEDLDFNNSFVIKPTQTLLFYDIKKTFAILPPDFSRLLIKVMSSISSFKSFNDVALETEMSLDEIIR